MLSAVSVPPGTGQRRSTRRRRGRQKSMPEEVGCGRWKGRLDRTRTQGQSPTSPEDAAGCRHPLSTRCACSPGVPRVAASGLRERLPCCTQFAAFTSVEVGARVVAWLLLRLRQTASCSTTSRRSACRADRRSLGRTTSRRRRTGQEWRPRCASPPVLHEMMLIQS